MTSTELLNLWRTRDRRYAIRRIPLTDRERESALAWRKLEIADLPPAQQPIAAVALASWSYR